MTVFERPDDHPDDIDALAASIDDIRGAIADEAGGIEGVRPNYADAWTGRSGHVAMSEFDAVKGFASTVDGAISDVEQPCVDYAEMLREAIDEIDRLNTEWEDADDAYDTDVNRADIDFAEEPQFRREAVDIAADRRTETRSDLQREYDDLMDRVDESARSFGSAMAGCATAITPGDPTSGDAATASAQIQLAQAGGTAPAFGLPKTAETPDSSGHASGAFDNTYGPMRAHGSGEFEAGGWADADGDFERWNDDSGMGVGMYGTAEAGGGVRGDFDLNAEMGPLDRRLTGSGTVGTFGEASGGAEASIGPTGVSSSISGEASVVSGAQGEIQDTMTYGDVAAVSTGASGTAGAWADASGRQHFSASDQGISSGGGFSASAGLGAKGSVSQSVDVGQGMFGGSAEVSGQAGFVASAGASADVDISYDRIRISAGGELAAVLGLGADAEIYVSPRRIVDFMFG